MTIRNYASSPNGVLKLAEIVGRQQAKDHKLIKMNF